MAFHLTSNSSAGNPMITQWPNGWMHEKRSWQGIFFEAPEQTRCVPWNTIVQSNPRKIATPQSHFLSASVKRTVSIQQSVYLNLNWSIFGWLNHLGWCRARSLIVFRIYISKITEFCKSSQVIQSNLSHSHPFNPLDHPRLSLRPLQGVE